MEPEQKLQQLKDLLAEIADLNQIIALLGWDQQVYMPPGGAENRGHQLATLQQIAHTKFVSDEMGKLLDDLNTHASQLDPDSFDACLVRVTRRDYEREKKVPGEWGAEIAMI